MRLKTFILFLSLSLKTFGDCKYHDPGTSNLPVREGYAEFISVNTLTPFKAVLPKVSDPQVDQILKSPDTMWYDDHSMVFLYQDSIEVVTGARANCVGRKVGEDNANNPGIAKLMDFFGPDYKFLFPFRTVAGTDNVTNIKTFTFWAPPKNKRGVLPVKWWKLSSRGRWRWAFPVGTVFGEVLYQQSSSGTWHVFEIRTRKRYLDGWDVNVFRPFRTSNEMAFAIMQKRPNWVADENLRKVIDYLQDDSTLTPHTAESKAYGKVFPPVRGALDLVPGIDDKALIKELLTDFSFQSMEGAVWKSNGTLETYAPSSQSDFSIVPKGYGSGIYPVNEVSCKRCHSETGRRLYDFNFDIQLYGEVWGEDQIFTWHLFEPSDMIWGTWDDTQGSRQVNKRMIQAGLLKNEKPADGDPIYKPLPTAFVPE